MYTKVIAIPCLNKSGRAVRKMFVNVSRMLLLAAVSILGLCDKFEVRRNVDQ